MMNSSYQNQTYQNQTREHPRTMRYAIMLAALLVFALAACGRGEEPTPMPTPTALPAAAANTPTPEPAEPEPTEAAEVEAEQPESPLQAESPLLVDSPLPTPTPEPVAYDASPAEGLAEVRGHTFNPITGAPIANAYIRLAELYCAPDVDPEEREDRCIWALDDAQSPFALSDEEGNFLFEDIPPGDYVFFVGTYTVKDGYAIALDENNIAMIFSPKADEGLDIGSVPVIYPPAPTGD